MQNVKIVVLLVYSMDINKELQYDSKIMKILCFIKLPWLAIIVAYIYIYIYIYICCMAQKFYMEFNLLFHS